MSAGMEALRERFLALPPAARRAVHDQIIDQAVARWIAYARREGPIRYRESVVGTEQVVDVDLPADAIAAVRSGVDAASVDRRYGEPMAALQDGDLVFPDPVAFGYYGIRNYFGTYALHEEVDDWLLVTQAGSSEKDERQWEPQLGKAIEDATRRTG